jgi:hypothetical protein
MNLISADASFLSMEFRGIALNPEILDHNEHVILMVPPFEDIRFADIRGQSSKNYRSLF